MAGLGLPLTSHTRLADWLNTSDTFNGASPSMKSGGTVEVERAGQEIISFSNPGV